MFIFNEFYIPVIQQKKKSVYSGRHYNTDREFIKSLLKKQESKLGLLRLRISLIERLKREEILTDLILLVDAARITNAAKAGLLQSLDSKSLESDVPIGLKDKIKMVCINKKSKSYCR